ncbi:hypothetical protein, partial [Providencia stuartii]|uniref:hypothetical protein n=1 Tax=Providencia stuartii TaxID=588 RepID=UPI003816E381
FFGFSEGVKRPLQGGGQGGVKRPLQVSEYGRNAKRFVYTSGSLVIFLFSLYSWGWFWGANDEKN